MSAATNSDQAAAGAVRERIFLVSCPKVVFLYPTYFMALIAGFYTAVTGPQEMESTGVSIINTTFMFVFALNLVVFSFDFPRTTSLTVFFLIASVVLGLLLLFRLQQDILPFVHDLLRHYKPWANSTFYFSIVAVLTVMFIAVLIGLQFDYWEVTSNELLHHHGFLSDLERFASPQLRIDKEINDVFEYMLLRSGRLILHPSDERRSIVLDNVLFISRKETQITKMLGSMKVQVVPTT